MGAKNREREGQREDGSEERTRGKTKVERTGCEMSERLVGIEKSSRKRVQHL